METWKSIDGYIGLYEVSSYGRVKALARTILNKHGKEQNYPEKYLKPDVFITNFSNYLRVTLCKNNTTKRHSVHRLVALAFIPNTENKECVNHLDNNGEHNTVDNLEWCTHAENMLHAQKQGRLFNSQSKGGKIGGTISAKLRTDSVKTLQGTRVGNWYVYQQPHIVRGRKAYLNCKCGCGTEQAIEVTRLIRQETLNCRACGQHRRRGS